MKRVFKQLWMWVIVILTTTTGYSQQPVMSADSIPAYSTVKGLIPDCDRPAVAFCHFQGGEWHFREQAGFGYSLLMNASGDAVNITPDFALSSVEDAQSNPLIKGLHGYIAGLSQDKNGNWCVSVNEELKGFDGFFWFRINAHWAMYLRQGCLNPVLVFDPGDPTPKGGEPKVTIVYRDTGSVKQCTTIVNCPPPPPPAPCESCCSADSVKYTFELFGVADFERIGGKLHRGFGFGLEFTQFSLHRNDKTENWFEKPVSFYGGVTAYVSKKGLEFTPTCDTCGYWGDIPSNKAAFRSDIFVGVQHRLFKKVGAFGFMEGRYNWFNSENQRAKFLSDEGIKARAGFRAVISTPRKMPIFRSIQVELGSQIVTYATPTNDLAVSPGGFLALSANIGARDEETRRELDTLRQQQAREQLQRDMKERDRRDSVQVVRDSVEFAEFLLANPEPIVLDSTEMYLEPTFVGQSNSVTHLNYKKVRVINLAHDVNRLRVSSSSAVDELKAKSKELKKLRKKVAKMQKKRAGKVKSEPAPNQSPGQ